MTMSDLPAFHDHTNESPAGLPDFTVFLMALLAESFLFSLLFLGHIPLGIALIGHACVFGGLGAYAAMDIEHRTLHAELSIWTAIAGPIGIILSGIGWLGRMAGKRTGGHDFNTWVEEDIRAEYREGSVEHLVESLNDNRMGLDTPKTLGSFTDYIASGEQDEQLNALRVIGANYGPDFAPALNAALVNPDAAVRVMAATILATLKKQYSDRLAELKIQSAEDQLVASLTIQRAEAHIDYADSGLLNDDLAREQYEMARKLLLDASEGSSQDDANRLALLEKIAANDSSNADGAIKPDGQQDLRAG